MAARWPKSAEIACSKRASLLRDRGAQPRQPVEPDIAARRRDRPRSSNMGVEGVVQGGQRRGFSGAGPWHFPVLEGMIRKGPKRPSGRIMPKQSDVLAGGHRKAPPYRNFWQEAAISGHFWPVLPVIKTKKGSPQPFPKRTCVGTYRLAPAGFSPRVAFSGSLLERKIGAAAALAHPRFVKQLSPEGAQWLIAGWSSPVARQAHNLKVIGSNPIPATKIEPKPGNPRWIAGFRLSERLEHDPEKRVAVFRKDHAQTKG